MRGAITSFVGRARELHVLSTCLLHPDIRLITLTGVGGVGKTRLAITVAEKLRHTFTGGVHFVSLAMLTEPALVLLTIARSLGIEEQPGSTVLKQLSTYLRAKRLLLILDNLEQVASAAPALTKLLAGAPGLSILVTSRIALQISGEHVFVVPPLSLPDLSCAPSLDILAENPAIALFVARAQAVVTNFLLTEHNGPVIAAICTQLEGLPLAIELAAARLRLFTPPALLARLDHRPAVLVGGGRDLHPRQQTMRNTIAWSYNLLSEPMQTLLVQLSVFVGGFSLGAAEAVGDLEDTELSITEAIEALIAQSLLCRVDQTEAEPRFAMLETIREYTLEQLVARGIATQVQERHAALGRAGRAGASGARASGVVRSPGAGSCQFQGDYTAAQTYLEEALAISSATGHVHLSAVLRFNLAVTAYHHQQFERALHLYQESLRASSQLGNTEGVVICLEGIGALCAASNDLECAALLFGAATQVRETAGLLAYSEAHDLFFQMIEDGRRRLGSVWEEHWNTGRAMTLDQVTATALAVSLPEGSSS